MKDELAIPDGWSANDVRRWLLQLFGRSGYSELPGLSSQMDAPVRIQALFDRSSTLIQEILKEGAVSALREWRYQAHGFRALDQLSRTTALLKSTAAVPVLAGIATRQMYCEDEPERLRSLSVIIACLCGFAPGADVEAALRRLFFDPRFKPVLAGQLFVGLCLCRPESYPLYVP